MAQRVLFVLCLSLPLHGQVIATISPQGAETLRALTGRRIPGLAVIEIQACNRLDKPVRIGAGHLYQAAQKAGIATVAPAAVASVIARSERRNWKRITIDVSRLLVTVGATLTVSGVVTASRDWQTALVVFPPLAELLADRLSARLEDTTVLQKNLLDGELELASLGCVSRLMLARYHPSLRPQVLEVP